jgi:hypothetical protein
LWIGHRPTQTHTDICPADIAGQKWSSLREEKTEVGGQGSVSKQSFSEKDVPAPQDPYAVSKREAELVSAFYDGRGDS